MKKTALLLAILGLLASCGKKDPGTSPDSTDGQVGLPGDVTPAADSTATAD